MQQLVIKISVFETYIAALGWLWCFPDIRGGTLVGSYLFLDYFAQSVKIAKWFSTAQ